MEVKAGYKQTDVGVIPKDWDVVQAGAIGRFRGGNGFPVKSQGKLTGAYPFYKVSDMNNEGNETFMTAANNWISVDTLKQLGVTVFPADSIIFAKVGAAVFLERKKILSRPSCIDNNVAAFVLDKNRADVRFIHLLMLNIKLGAFANATALPSLSGSALSQIELPLPPLPEQRAIAKALSDIDALIASLDTLIAKKRDLKQAVMQQLLTGKTRLKGFTGGWETKRLSELGTFLKGSGVRKDQALSGSLPCVRYGEIYTHHQDYVRAFHSWISDEVAMSATRLKQGDLLFAGSGETKAEIGKCVAFTDAIEAYAGGDIVIFRPTDLDARFMGYYCNGTEVSKQKASKGQGDAVVHISASALASITVTLPSVHEQSAIASILYDLDTELDKLVKRRAKTMALKHGMMQELLTGRTRLV